MRYNTEWGIFYGIQRTRIVYEIWMRPWQWTWWDIWLNFSHWVCIISLIEFIDEYLYCGVAVSMVDAKCRGGGTSTCWIPGKTNLGNERFKIGSDFRWSAWTGLLVWLYVTFLLRYKKLKYIRCNLLWVVSTTY